MDKNYSRTIKLKLDNVYKGGTGGPGARGDKVERENRLAFIVCAIWPFCTSRPPLMLEQILLNDLEISSSHMERLVKDLSQSTLISHHFVEAEVDTVKNSLSSFLSLVPKYRSTLRVSTVSQVRVPVTLMD